MALAESPLGIMPWHPPADGRLLGSGSAIQEHGTAGGRPRFPPHDVALARAMGKADSRRPGASLPARGRPPEAAARRAGLEEE